MISVRGVNFVTHWEGFRSCPYQDLAGVWTRGYGETEGIGPRSKCVTEAEAKHDLHRRLNGRYNALQLVPRVKFKQCELDGLSSLAYNEGPGVLSDPSFSTLAKRLRTQRARHSYWYRKRIYRQELPKWVIAGGARQEGLVKRRAAEIRVVCNGDYSGRP